MHMNEKKIKILKEIKNNINNCNDVNKREVIKNIIQYEKWYVKMDINTFVSILMDIGYSKITAIEYYKKIVIGI